MTIEERRDMILELYSIPKGSIGIQEGESYAELYVRLKAEILAKVESSHEKV